MAAPNRARAAPARADSDPQTEQAGRPLNPQDNPEVSAAQERRCDALLPEYIETSLLAVFDAVFDAQRGGRR